LEKKRLVYIDIIRFFAMLLVILAHSCSEIISQHPHNSNWNLANSMVVVTEIAVPLFFMISGASILNSEKTLSLKYLFQHRLIRILLPFLVWSVISAFIYSYLYPRFQIDPVESLLKIFHTPVLVAYWFIYPLITLYLLSPLLKAMVSHVDDGLLTYALVLWMILSIVLPMVVQTTPKSVGIYFNSYPMGRIVVSKSLGYFILGYRLTRSKHLHINVWFNSLLIIALMGINIWISFLSLDKSLQYLRIISEINIPIIAGLIYLTLRSLEPYYHRWFAKIIEYIAPLTYGVYLMHGIVILYLQRYFFSYNDYFSVFAITAASCLLVMALLNSIPLVKRLFT